MGDDVSLTSLLTATGDIAATKTDAVKRPSLRSELQQEAVEQSNYDQAHISTSAHYLQQTLRNFAAESDSPVTDRAALLASLRQQIQEKGFLEIDSLALSKAIINEEIGQS